MNDAMATHILDSQSDHRAVCFQFMIPKLNVIRNTRSNVIRNTIPGERYRKMICEILDASITQTDSLSDLTSIMLKATEEMSEMIKKNEQPYKIIEVQELLNPRRFCSGVKRKIICKQIQHEIRKQTRRIMTEKTEEPLK